MQEPHARPQAAPVNPDPAGLMLGAGQLLDRVRGTTASMGKLALVGILMGLLLIPMGMVKGLIHEREQRRGEAEREVAGKWGGNQVLGGPILTVPFRVHGTDAQGRPDTTISHANFLPEDLEIAGTLVPEIRRRGIFEIPLFQADLEIKGRFLQPSFAPWKAKPEDILWDEAYLTLHVPDLRTVNDAAPLDWSGQARALAPENLPGSPVQGGLQARVPLAAAGPEGGNYLFNSRLRLNGSGSIQFTPMGKRTQVNVKSPWSTPSFSGAFLPEARTLNAAGFQADWRTLHLSRSFPQSWLKGEIKPADWEAFAFGVDLLLPVDGYQKAERCAKYAFLFILLTFLVFFLYETFDRARIHPLQYLLVGFALCLFYLMLLSLSEHFAFQYAYLAATFGIAGMITLYGFAILGARKRALGLGAMLAGLYGYLYTLLQMEDYALLMGSLGLFAILAAVMFLTRKVNWYGGKPVDRQSPMEAAGAAA